MLTNELAKTRAAAPVAREGARLHSHYGSDHTFPHLPAMLVATLELLEHDPGEVLPALARGFGR